jgi:hypothetical protein
MFFFGILLDPPLAGITAIHVSIIVLCLGAVCCASSDLPCKGTHVYPGRRNIPKNVGTSANQAFIADTDRLNDVRTRAYHTVVADRDSSAESDSGCYVNVFPDMAIVFNGAVRINNARFADFSPGVDHHTIEDDRSWTKIYFFIDNSMG